MAAAEEGQASASAQHSARRADLANKRIAELEAALANAEVRAARVEDTLSEAQLSRTELVTVKASLADAEARLEAIPSILSLTLRQGDATLWDLRMPWLGYYVRDDRASDSRPSWQHAVNRRFRIVSVACPTSPGSAAACWLVQPTTREARWEGYARLNVQGARLPYGGVSSMIIDHPATVHCEIVECCICYGETAAACCSYGEHALCSGCFVKYAREWLASGPADVKQQHEGCLPCLCHPQAAGGCAASFDNQVVARLLSFQDYEQFDEQRRTEMRRRQFVRLNEQMMCMIRQMAERLNQSAPGLSKQLLAEQLRASIPGARMCGRCHYGPIEHFACSDLRTHRYESVTGNACPKCRWFADDINHWPPWDGNVPDSAVDSVNFAPTVGSVSMSTSVDLAIAQKMQEDERRRLRQIERDHAMALDLQRRGA